MVVVVLGSLPPKRRRRRRSKKSMELGWTPVLSSANPTVDQSL